MSITPKAIQDLLDELEASKQKRKDRSKGEWPRTCTIVTGEPNEFVREIHTRMPAFCHDAWLSGEAGKEILVPFPADRE